MGDREKNTGIKDPRQGYSFDLIPRCTGYHLLHSMTKGDEVIGSHLCLVIRWQRKTYRQRLKLW